jgi:hypothetical protein
MLPKEVTPLAPLSPLGRGAGGEALAPRGRMLIRPKPQGKRSAPWGSHDVTFIPIVRCA